MFPVRTSTPASQARRKAKSSDGVGIKRCFHVVVRGISSCHLHRFEEINGGGASTRLENRSPGRLPVESCLEGMEVRRQGLSQRDVGNDPGERDTVEKPI